MTYFLIILLICRMSFRENFRQVNGYILQIKCVSIKIPTDSKDEFSRKIYKSFIHMNKKCIG